MVVLLTPVWWSLGSALTNPGLGTTVSARFAEWLRGHGGGSLVTWAENTWYSHHPPPVGGKPAKGAIPLPDATDADPCIVATATSGPSGAAEPHRARRQPAVAGEGQWHPAGRLVDGLPALYEAFVRPDAVHTSVVMGVAWMDTKLLSATLYSGSTIPGGGPWHDTAPGLRHERRTDLVAAFNAGFLMSNAEGGYYTQGQTVLPLRAGAASFVIYTDGRPRWASGDGT